MCSLEVGLEVGVVDVVLVSAGAVAYADEALLVLVSAVQEELVTVVERDPAELARRVACEAGVLWVVRRCGLRITVSNMHRQAVGRKEGVLVGWMDRSSEVKCIGQPASQPARLLACSLARFAFYGGHISATY